VLSEFGGGWGGGEFGGGGEMGKRGNLTTQKPFFWVYYKAQLLLGPSLILRT